MVGLLDGGIAAIFGAAFGGFYLDATLWRLTPYSYDTGGTAVGGAWSPMPCKAQLEAATWAMRQAEGFTTADQRILVLTATLAVRPSTDDEITVGGQRWLIESVAQDPAASYWELRGRRA